MQLIQLLPENKASLMVWEPSDEMTFRADPTDLENLYEIMKTIPQKTKTLYGKKYSEPRHVALFGQHSYAYSGCVYEPEPPCGGDTLIEKSKHWVEQQFPGLKWNDALVNLYIDGAHSVDWHKDDEKTIEPGSPIVSFSFGPGASARTFEVSKSRTKKDIVYSTKTTHGMILAMCGPNFQTDLYHRVPPITNTKTHPNRSDVGWRINITYRVSSAWGVSKSTV